jgi:hypothetical protein
MQRIPNCSRRLRAGAGRYAAQAHGTGQGRSERRTGSATEPAVKHGGPPASARAHNGMPGLQARAVFPSRFGRLGGLELRRTPPPTRFPTRFGLCPRGRGTRSEERTLLPGIAWECNVVRSDWPALGGMRVASNKVFVASSAVFATMSERGDVHAAARGGEICGVKRRGLDNCQCSE